MAACEKCGAGKLTERPCPKCGGLLNRELSDRKRALKTQPSHYRKRLAVLRARATYLRTRVDANVRSERGTSHDLAEISALEWAIEIITPWFAKDEDPPIAAALRASSADTETKT